MGTVSTSPCGPQTVGFLFYRQGLERLTVEVCRCLRPANSAAQMRYMTPNGTAEGGANLTKTHRTPPARRTVCGTSRYRSKAATLCTYARMSETHPMPPSSQKPKQRFSIARETLFVCQRQRRGRRSPQYSDSNQTSRQPCCAKPDRWLVNQSIPIPAF